MFKLIEPPHFFFLEEPEVSLLGLHDADLRSLFSKKTLTFRPDSKWYGIYKEKELISVVRMEPLNKKTVIIHAYLRKQFHGKGMLKSIYTEITEWLKENTKYNRIVVPVPKCCEHVIRALPSLGMKLKYVIPRGIEWREQLNDLLVYHRKI